ncbi:MAG: SUMF1/EgtB/PvdO family nonheme iron enzyme [Candidatus Omnitrophica bacterium]|nr:SUMF1/EgtB/PvdO family nonheme iron enzyme [Candidatus Omnitrophota bacterium]
MHEELITIAFPGGDSLYGDAEMTFRYIPAGSFMMGSHGTEKDREENEGPQHEVTITKPFYMGIHEVTQRQWAAIMSTYPSESTRKDSSQKGLWRQKYYYPSSSVSKNDPDCPVESVFWNDCQEFIKQLNSLGKGTFRLPTEAEWEYACRAGTTTRFYWGVDLDYKDISQYAWHTIKKPSGREIVEKPHPVGQKKANPWGLYDMSGNVWEWCLDLYAPYTEAPQMDPLVTQSDDLRRVIRGGSWRRYAMRCRSAQRNASLPNHSTDFIGLRLIKEIEIEEKEIIPVPKDSDQDGVIDDRDKCPNTPKGAKVDEDGCWILEPIYFELDRYEIKPEFHAFLDHVAHVLTLNPNLKMQINGHTCSLATEKYNLSLSENRAKAVLNYLLTKHAHKENLETKWWGENIPAAPNDSEENMKKNRRVELQVLSNEN